MKNKINTTSNKSIKAIIGTILKAMPIAMGVAVITLSILNAIQTTEAVLLLGIGVTSAGIDNMAHISGFLIGALLGGLLYRRKRYRKQNTKRAAGTW